METDKLTPDKSFELITEVIAQARNKFEENGLFYVFWGALIAVAAMSQFVLIQKEYYEISWYPYFLMPIGSIITGFYYSKESQQTKSNQIDKIVSKTWMILSLNMLILGFVFATVLKEHLIPFMLILLSMGIIVSSIAIKSRLVFYAGILINLAAFVSFSIEWMYHPLLLAIISIVAVFFPGVWLVIQKRKRDNV